MVSINTATSLIFTGMLSSNGKDTNLYFQHSKAEGDTDDYFYTLSKAVQKERLQKKKSFIAFSDISTQV